MALSVGTRLGPHEILAPIGAGGMERSTKLTTLASEIIANWTEELKRLTSN